MGTLGLTILATQLLYLSTNVMNVGAFYCINIPPPPLHGTLIGPRGFFRATLVCPHGKDVPLNSRSEGSLECDPREKPYEFLNIPRHQCLPIKKPNALNIDIELIYYGGGNCHSAGKFVKNEVELRLPNVAPDNLPPELKEKSSKGLKVQWLQTRVTCTATKAIKNGQPVNEIIVKPTLRVTYSDMNREAMFYLKIANLIRERIFNRSDFDVNITPQKRWVVGGEFQLNWTYYSSLYAACDNHPNTLGTVLHETKMVSCRGCSRDYYLPEKARRCKVCREGKYTLTPFASSCVPCPPKSEWKEGDELYERFCENFQADYDLNF